MKKESEVSLYQLIENACYDSEAGWQNEDLKRRNAKHTAGVVYNAIKDVVK